MYRSTCFLTAALVGTSVVLVQPAVMAAKSAAEVESIARGVTVEIRLQQDSSVGSGIIVAHQGDLYTIVTNRHVVCGSQRRDRVPAGESYELGLVDGQKYRVQAAAVKLVGTDLDLAIVQFRSSRKYAVAQMSTDSALKVEDVVYTAGFPLEQPGFSFNQGNAIAVVDRRITGDRGGYSVIYNAFTLPGMSGGGVFDSNARLLAIHGQGDRYQENTEIDDKSKIGSKIGYNRGIPVRWMAKSLVDMGIERAISSLKVALPQMSVSADEYFIAGFNKFVEPGDDVVAGKLTAIQEFSKAIEINPRYASAYFSRALVYAQIQEFRRALSDYDRAIALNPQFSLAYNNRALLKAGNFNDLPGALGDLDRAIALNPKFSLAYNNRALFKAEKFSDGQSALTDYDRAIALNPKDFLAYYNRAILKADKLNDAPGALTDYDRAIALNPKDVLSYYNRAILKAGKLNDAPGALTDYDRAIALNPKYSLAYNNRASLKADKLNDLPGALGDLDRAIAINPKDSQAYYNRGSLLAFKLNNLPGALTDYDRAISLNPKYSFAYFNRALLKAAKLNDKAGAIQDLRQAARLFRELGQTQYLQKAVDLLRQLGATE
jgi:tetratricopeptide (TPR) repeat protein